MKDAEETALSGAAAKFEAKFCDTGAFGVIEGGDGRIVWLTLFLDSSIANPVRASIFITDDEKPALLVGYENAEKLLDQSQVAPKAEHVTFPLNFDGMPVIYRQVDIATIRELERVSKAKPKLAAFRR